MMKLQNITQVETNKQIKKRVVLIKVRIKDLEQGFLTLRADDQNRSVAC